MKKDSLSITLCKALLLAGLVLYLLPIHSCQKAHKAELAKLDSLLILLDSSSTRVNSIDSVKVKAYHTQIENNLRFFQANYTDTLTKELAIFLLNYRSIKKSLDNYLHEANSLKQNLEFTQTQVKLLRQDIKNNALNTREVQHYYKREREVAGKLVDAVTFLTNNVEEAIAKFEAMNPRVKTLISTLAH